MYGSMAWKCWCQPAICYVKHRRKRDIAYHGRYVAFVELIGFIPDKKTKLWQSQASSINLIPNAVTKSFLFGARDILNNMRRLHHALRRISGHFGDVEWVAMAKILPFQTSHLQISTTWWNKSHRTRYASVPSCRGAPTSSEKDLARFKRETRWKIFPTSARRPTKPLNTLLGCMCLAIGFTAEKELDFWPVTGLGSQREPCWGLLRLRGMIWSLRRRKSGIELRSELE